MEFKIGDPVRYKGKEPGGPYDLVGIIRSKLTEARNINYKYLVEFHGFLEGHTGQGLKLINSFKTNVPNCWYCTDNDLELISSKPKAFELGSLVTPDTLEYIEAEVFQKLISTVQSYTDSVFKNKEMEESKMDSETIKTFNKNNLKAGKELAEKEKADYETQQAKNYYTALINRKQEVDRIIAEYKKELENINEKLSLYK